MKHKRFLSIGITLFIMYGLLYPGIRDGTCSYHTTIEEHNYKKTHNLPEVIPGYSCPIPLFWYILAKQNGGTIEIQLGHDIYGFMASGNKWYDINIIGSLFSNIIPISVSVISIIIYYKILSRNKSRY